MRELAPIMRGLRGRQLGSPTAWTWPG